MPLTLAKVAAKTAQELCRGWDLEGPEAGALLTPEATPAAFLEALIRKTYYSDAVRLLAAGLPPRDGVRWACLCAREQKEPPIPKEAMRALEGAERWVAQPDEANRRAAFDGAQGQMGTPAGCAASAAYFSEGSITPEGTPPVPPPEGVAAKMVSGGVLLAAAIGDPRNASDRFRRFLQLGVGVANQGL